MKTISKFLFVLFILFQASLFYADDLRVMVSMFEDKDGDKELGRRLAIVCSEEVIRLKGFRYISTTESVKIATKNEEIVIDKAVDLEKEYSDKNIEYLQKMSEPYKNKSFDNFFRMLESTDIIIGGSVQRNGPLVKVELMMNNGRNQKQYDVTVECEENHLDAEMRKAVRDLLKKISRPVKIYADKLVDAKESRVIYVVKAMDKTDIAIEMDYTGDRPNPQIQNVSIMPPAGIDVINGTTTLKVMSEEGKTIHIDFSYKQRKLDNIRVYTPIPDQSSAAEQEETLTMKSKAGYLLTLAFEWKGKELQSTKLEPKINPFGGNQE